MATNIPYFYNGKNLASLAAKSRNHQLGVSYIDPEKSKYLNFTPDDSSKHRFIPYNPGKITDANGNNIWGGTKATFSPSFDSKAESGYDQLNNVAAWGSAPIPARRAFGTTYNNRTTDTDTKYTTTSFIELPATLTLTWNSSTGITRSDTNAVLTKASCIIVDVCAGGGTGGNGYYSGSTYGKHSGGGGGGAGAAASLCIDMSKASKITFTNSAGTVQIKNSNGTPFLTLNKGGNGGNGGTNYTRGTGGSGGTYTHNTTAPAGVKVLWAQAGAAGGQGGNNNSTGDNHPLYGWSMFGYGRKGGDAPKSITFINTNIITWYGGGLDKTSSASSGAGGGGGASIFAAGTAGMNEMFRDQDRLAQFGAGGGGGCGCNSSPAPAHGWTAGWSGGGAAMCVHFETETDEGYGTEALNTTSSQLTPTYDSRDKDPGWNGENGGGSSGGTGCVFPGTQIALDETQSVDIVDYEPRSPLAYCNHDTLEYSIQRSPAKLIYRKATQKVTLTLEDGKTIALTPNHAIFTKDGLKQYLATETTCGYVVGDEIATVDGYKKLTSIVEETIEPTAVYNIITETNFMVANGIIIAGELNFDLAAAEERAAQKARAARGVSTWALVLPGGPGDEGSKEIM